MTDTTHYLLAMENASQKLHTIRCVETFDDAELLQAVLEQQELLLEHFRNGFYKTMKTRTIDITAYYRLYARVTGILCWEHMRGYFLTGHTKIIIARREVKKDG